jgi:hypothetical protein
MIETPKPDIGRSVWRAVFEAGAQFIPVTAALARLYQTTHPSKFEQDVQAWSSAITDTVNTHEERLQALETTDQPQMTLSSAAQALAVWLARESPSALGNRFGYVDVKAAFPDVERRNLEDAVAELKQARLVEVLSAIGQPILKIMPTTDLYLLMDPVAVGTSPQADAVQLAREALALDGGRVREIAERLGWSPRRVNPALALLLPLVSIRSNEISPDYLTNWFTLGADERVGFRRLIQGFEQTQPRPEPA